MLTSVYRATVCRRTYQRARALCLNHTKWQVWC